MTLLARWIVLAATVFFAHCGGQASNGDSADRPLNETSSSPALASVASILADDQWVGDTVRLEGRCIGYAEVVATGPQPRTRSDWQLVDGDAAIWVVGAYPPGCSATEPAAEPGDYTMVVAEDTLPALGERPRTTRRYLIHPR